MIAFLLALLISCAPAPATAQTAPPQPQPAQGSPDEAAASTLSQDISTAGYYELVAWCQQLGLDDAGSRHDLQQRLANHFAVSLPAVTAAPKRTITVRGARESEYYTQSDVNEKYVLLRGDVNIEVRDEKDGTLQAIKADTVTYNQTRGKVSAQGGVSYSLTRGGQTDTFTGQSLDFDLESSEAVFYDGSTRRAIKRAGTDVPYSFKGQTITRFSNDTVILQNGSFTSSSTPDDPLYQVRASTVWLLAPSEWAIQNVLLMVGRVPIFYLPAFFWPGDDFFFNPNFGFRSREGSFLQTTTYLFGRKPKQDSPLSFLQIADSGDTGYSLEPHGMFLRKVPGSAAGPADTRSLKLLVDAYTRLGVFTGLAGDFSPLATFRTGIGVSRTIFPTTAFGYPYDLYQTYTPFWVEPDGTLPSYWNSSSLFGLVVPFRLGLEGSLLMSGDIYSLKAGFQYFSDPSFTSDFYNRSEANMLSTLLSQQTTTLSTPAKQANLSWDLAGTLDFTKLVGLPFVQTLSIPNINLKVTWLSKDGPFLNPFSTQPTDPQDYDPGRTFYYPSSITAPNLSLSAAGDVLSLSTSTTAAPAASGGKTDANPSAAPAADPGKGLRVPSAPGAERPQASPQAARIPFREPAQQADVQQAQNAGASSLKVSYQVQPRATFEHTFDTTNWVKKEDVDYSIRYRTFEVGGSGSVTAAASFLDRLADMSLGLSTDGLWRTRFDPSALELASADWQSQLLRDMQQDRIALRSSLQGTLRPFPAIPALSSSNIQYRLGVRLYQVSLAGIDPLNPVFVSAGPDWTTSTITENSLQSTFILGTSWTSDTLALTVLLPPQIPSLTGRLDVGVAPFKGTIQGGFSQPSTFFFQPLIVSGTLDFGSGFGASEEVQLDIANALIAKSTSQLNLGNLSASIVAQESGALSLLLPSTLKIGYESGGTPLWFWKDRVKLDLSIKSHWNMNLQNYLDNLFDFNLGINLTIFKFLDLSVSSVSTNSKTYRYFPALAAAEGETWVNPLSDLLESFNFFDTRASAFNDRVRSAFKIRTLSVKAVQHFPDWDLSFQYQGSPQLRRDPADNVLKFMWTPSFSIQVQWIAVSEAKSAVHGDYTGMFLR
jgi:lipopolysaccharide assembly outer membrane protein LptD (OstA)